LPQSYTTYLRTVPMFSACSSNELGEIARLIERIEVTEGAVLVREGTRNKEFFVLVDGYAVVSRRGQTLGMLAPGRHFGELALLDPAPRKATVTMATDGEVLVLSQRDFHALVRDIPGLVKQLLTGLAQRVHDLDPTPVR
jgi:CRP-like cAMP-binding protein